MTDEKQIPNPDAPEESEPQYADDAPGVGARRVLTPTVLRRLVVGLIANTNHNDCTVVVGKRGGPGDSLGYTVEILKPGVRSLIMPQVDERRLAEATETDDAYEMRFRNPITGEIVQTPGPLRPSKAIEAELVTEASARMAVRLARFEAFGEAIDLARSLVTPLDQDGRGYPSHEAAAETAEEIARRIEELRSAAKPAPHGPPLAAHGIDIEECIVNDIVRWVRRCADNNVSLAAQLGDAKEAEWSQRDSRCFRFIAEQIQERAWQRLEGPQSVTEHAADVALDALAAAPIEKARPCVTPCAICGTDPDYPPKSAPNARADWTDEDPGTCTECGKSFELVRPGKSQPTCLCWETDRLSTEQESK